jgi:hypothetical protein
VGIGKSYRLYNQRRSATLPAGRGRPLVLSIAKLAGAITLSWWCVLAPAWIPVAGVVLCGAAILVTK